MKFLNEISASIKKLCNDDQVCLMVVFVLICMGLLWLFEGNISGYANFSEFVGGSTREPNQGPTQGPTQGPKVANEQAIGIELKPRKPLPTPSTKRQLEVMAEKPAVPQGTVKHGTGMMTQDSVIFKPFDEIWNPGFMPLNMVFQNVQENISGSIIQKPGMGTDQPRGMGADRPRGMGADRPQGTSMTGTSQGANGEVDLVLLYAPWCGHSKNMLPDYERVKSEFDGKVINGKKVSITMYDSDIDKDKVKEYGVKGFPTLFIEKDGQREPFPHRSYDKISGYLNSL